MHAVRQMHASCKAPSCTSSSGAGACQASQPPEEGRARQQEPCEGAHPVLDRDAARLSHVQLVCVQLLVLSADLRAAGFLFGFQKEKPPTKPKSAFKICL